MSDAYKIGKGRAAKTVNARQYTRDQDWNLANWLHGPVQVFRDHFRVGLEGDRASKGDWLVKWHDGRIEVKSHREFTEIATKVEEDK